MSPLSLQSDIFDVDSRIVAAIAGMATCIYLHNVPMRGDVGLGLEIAIASALYSFSRFALGAGVWASITFSVAIITWHVGAIILATIAYRLSPFHPLAQFPGPLLNKVTSLKIAYVVWTGKRYLVVHAMHEKYGKFVRTGPNTLSINSHSAVSPIYASSTAFSKSNAYIPGGLRGSGLFFIQSREEHNIRKRHWAPAFTPQVVASYKPELEERTNQLMECIAERREGPDGAIDLSRAIQQWSYDVMGSLTFGGANRLELMKDNDIGHYVKSGQAATVAFEVLGEVPSLFNIVWHLPLTKVIRILEGLTAALLVTRQKSGACEHNDIASYLLGEHDSALPKLTTEDLRIETLFAVQAGSDTTSGVLTFVFYYLLSDRKVYDRLQGELDEAFPDPSGPLNAATLSALPFLNAVVDESIRLGTPFGGLPRITPAGGALIDSTFVPEGTIVAVPPYAQAISSENFWPEPLAYMPERWLPGGLGPGSRADKSAILSFSCGTFACLGKSLAIQELRIVTTRMMLTYNLRLAPDFDTAAFNEGTNNMRTTIFEYPLRVVAEPRY